MVVKTLQDAMWTNERDRLPRARQEVEKLRKRGDVLGAHCLLLSTYLTMLGGKPVEGRHPIKFGVLALWHACVLQWGWKKLDHNQLDVLIRLWFRVFELVPGVAFLWRRRILEMAIHEKAKAEESDAIPHQRALAILAQAEAYLWCKDEAHARIRIREALELEEEIRAEANQLQGLRQFVRILRIVGELCLLMGEQKKGVIFLGGALGLASSPFVQADDQLPKIMEILRRFGMPTGS